MSGVMSGCITNYSTNNFHFPPIEFPYASLHTLIDDGASLSEFQKIKWNTKQLNELREGVSPLLSLMNAYSRPQNLDQIDQLDQIAQLFIEQGADPNLLCQKSDGSFEQYPLYVSICLKLYKIAALLLAHGAEVDHLNSQNSTNFKETALHRLVNQKFVDSQQLCILSELIKKTKDVDLQDDKGRTALMRCESKEYAELLVAAKAKFTLLDKNGISVLGHHIKGEDELAQYMVSIAPKEGINVGTIPILTCVFSYISNLEQAEHRIKLAAGVIEKGARVNDTDRNGMNSLHWAAGKLDPSLVQFLIGQGADLNSQDKDGDTPLHHTVGDESIIYSLFWPTIQALLDGGADPLIQNKAEKTLLLKISQINCEDEEEQSDLRNIVQKLISSRPSLMNIADDNGDTPLHYFAQENPEITRFCLENEANRGARNKQNKLPLDYVFMHDEKNKTLEVFHTYQLQELEKCKKLVEDGQLKNLDQIQGILSQYAADDETYQKYQVDPSLPGEEAIGAMSILISTQFEHLIKNQINHLNYQSSEQNFSLHEVKELHAKCQGFAAFLSKIDTLFQKKFNSSLQQHCRKKIDLALRQIEDLTKKGESRMSEHLEYEEEKFDNGDVFQLLTGLGLGVRGQTGGKNYSPKDSFMLLIGLSDTSKFYECGILEGKDLRTIGLTFTFRYLCDRIASYAENDTQKRDSVWEKLLEELEPTSHRCYSLVPQATQEKWSALYETIKFSIDFAFFGTDEKVQLDEIRNLHREICLELLKRFLAQDSMMIKNFLAAAHVDALSKLRTLTIDQLYNLSSYIPSGDQSSNLSPATPPLSRKRKREEKG